MTPVSSIDASSEPFSAWRPSSWAWDDRPRSHLLFGSETGDLSCRQAVVGYANADDSINERVQPLQRVPLDVAIVQAKDKLIDVPLQVFLARLVIDALESSLKDRPHA